MTRAACSLVVVAALASAAHAGTPEPDEIADTEAKEANLESNAPRKGFVLAGAIGFGILIGGDIGVGRGPAASLRLGHVATRKTIITFEFVGTGGLHKDMATDNTLTDSSIGLFAGAQRYTAPSVWVRLAGGLDVFTADVGEGGMAAKPRSGIGGLVGGGLDLARWGYLVFGFETFGMASVTGDGFKFQVGFCTNLSYY